jgi:hypothetical protein
LFFKRPPPNPEYDQQMRLKNLLLGQGATPSGPISNQVRPAAADREMRRSPSPSWEADYGSTQPGHAAQPAQGWQQARQTFANGLEGFANGMADFNLSGDQRLRQGMQQLAEGLRYRLAPENQFPAAPGGGGGSWADMFGRIIARRNSGGLY